MKEIEKQAEGLEAFRVSFDYGIDELLENEGFLDLPLPLDPYSMGIDERTIDELSSEEKVIVKGAIYKKFGLVAERLEEARIRTYTTVTAQEATVPGEIKVEVFRTNRERIFLQELTFRNGDKSWVVGPDQVI